MALIEHTFKVVIKFRVISFLVIRFSFRSIKLVLLLVFADGQLGDGPVHRVVITLTPSHAFRRSVFGPPATDIGIEKAPGLTTGCDRHQRL